MENYSAAVKGWNQQITAPFMPRLARHSGFVLQKQFPGSVQIFVEMTMD
jgi:hypothetical protein